MAIESDGTAPYAPPRTVLEIVHRYRDRGLQTPFTLAVLTKAGVPESLAPRTLQALKLLDLVDDEGDPTAAMVELQKAPQDAFAARFAAVLRAAYADVFAFTDPAQDPPDRIRDAFRNYDPRGQQRRMVTLFLGLCAAAEIIDEATRRAAAPKGGAAIRRSSAASAKTNRSAHPTVETTRRPTEQSSAGAAAKTAEFKPSPAPSTGSHPFIEGLLENLPPVGTVWPAAKRDAWMKLAEAAFNVMYEPEATTPPKE